ncbi:MAG: hypothetical protein IH840_09130 [Candidatus Heimdallarchaeota archaeon]|nr:hypothetical protein [Candidatus Heimdallarchaeota archaeon]
MSKEFRSLSEKLLDDLHELKYDMQEDYDEDGVRIVQFRRHTVWITLQIKDETIDFDVYGDLSAGIYELGDLHLLTRRMLEVKKVCLSYEAREMNTTERLYPKNRQGKETKTSGL